MEASHKSKQKSTISIQLNLIHKYHLSLHFQINENFYHFFLQKLLLFFILEKISLYDHSVQLVAFQKYWGFSIKVHSLLFSKYEFYLKVFLTNFYLQKNKFLNKLVSLSMNLKFINFQIYLNFLN